MKSHCMNLSLILALAMTAGCLPEKRIVWSPDGQRAAVATPNGLFFIDSKGIVLPSKLTQTPARCEWFADGRRLAVAHTRKVKGWNDVKGLYTAQQVEAIVKAAEDAHTRAMSYDGNWDDFKFDPQDTLTSGMETAAFLCLRDEHAQGLPDKLGAKWEEFQKIEPAVWLLQVFTWKESALEEGVVLTRTLEEIRQPHISPDGKNVAFLMNTSTSRNEALSIYLAPSGGGGIRNVADNVSVDYSWSPDGRYLAYIGCNSPTSDDQRTIQLGAVTTVAVADKAGMLLKEWSERNERVGLLFNGSLSVKWLRDGRLLFSSFEVTLPATPRDMPQEWSLFVLDPRMPASVTRVLARDLAHPREPSLPLFELSPDESNVLLRGSKGRFSLYNFASGDETDLVSADDPKGQMRCLASWQTIRK
jgi:WD40 repeat protein